MARRNECPMTPEYFIRTAKPLHINMSGRRIVAEPRIFKTGSFGWYWQGKIETDVEDELLRCQTNIAVTVIGSKPEKA